MTRKSDSLDRLSIGNSCTANWEAMTGDRQKRFCQECNKNVYNFSAMTRDEIVAAVAPFEGGLCARTERAPGGAIIPAAMPAAPQLISRRVSPVAAVLVTALLGL